MDLVFSKSPNMDDNYMQHVNHPPHLHHSFQDQKKLQGQLIAEQEALFGSKPSPLKPQSVKKGGPRLSCGGPGGGTSNRRLSLGGPRADPLVKATPNTRQTKKNDRLHQNDHLNHQRDDGVGALSAGKFCEMYPFFVIPDVFGTLGSTC